MTCWETAYMASKILEALVWVSNIYSYSVASNYGGKVKQWFLCKYDIIYNVMRMRQLHIPIKKYIILYGRSTQMQLRLPIYTPSMLRILSKLQLQCMSNELGMVFVELIYIMMTVHLFCIKLRSLVGAMVTISFNHSRYPKHVCVWLPALWKYRKTTWSFALPGSCSSFRRSY